MKHYRPISLLSILGKVFEKLIYNSIFNYYISNKLFTPSQYGFFQETHIFPNYYQQYLTCELATSDNNLTVDVRGVFLDISEGFDQIWHDGLLFKLKNIVLKVNYFHFSNTISKILNKEFLNWSNIWVEKYKF